MAPRKHTQPASSGQPCGSPGCTQPGEHKAPKSREDLRDYQWLCLEHVRAFNQTWNYFQGMETDEIEHFMHDSLTGHRPTWQREDHIKRKTKDYREALHESISRFFNWDEASIRRANVEKLPAKERRALTTLELAAPCTAPELKAHFRTLVKRYHPDLHHGDKEVEEKFKHINTAYRYLLKQYEQ